MATTRKRPLALRCGALIRRVREKHGLDQSELARRLGTSQAAISRLERDQVSPTIDTLARLLEAMGEALDLRSIPLSEPPPGGGNVSIADLRADYELLTPEERLAQAAELGRIATELASQA